MAEVTTTPLIWDKAHECLDREQMQELQLKRMQELVHRVYEKVPFYRKAFDAQGIKPGDVKSLADVAKLPFTTKTDLRDNYPFGLFATSTDDIVRLHASSGTTGKPIVGAYTRNDMELWMQAMARTLTAGSVTHKDIVHNSYGYGLFTGGLGFHYGAEKIGCAVVPVASGLSRRQIMLWEDFGATVLLCTPSYALVLAETAEEMGVDVKSSCKLRVGFFGAEPWTAEMRKDIENRLGIEAFDIYGLTEIIGPGVAVECPYHNGLHIQEDFFYPEIIDPETGEPLPYGSKGELVFSAMTKEAFPVLRYRTRDLTVLHAEPCECGRTTVRMEKIFGRTDDMLIIRGVNVFPSQIESVLLTVPGLEPQYVIVVDRAKNSLDDIEVRVEASDVLWSQGENALADTVNLIKQSMHDVLGLTPKIRIVEPRSIQRSEGKAKRVVDLREVPM